MNAVLGESGSNQAIPALRTGLPPAPEASLQPDGSAPAEASPLFTPNCSRALPLPKCSLFRTARAGFKILTLYYTNEFTFLVIEPLTPTSLGAPFTIKSLPKQNTPVLVTLKNTKRFGVYRTVMFLRMRIHSEKCAIK